MPAPRPLRWLHLSDLHLGCRGEDLWWQMQAEWEPSVKATAARLGPPDLLLLSGDLANRGDEKEYERVDRSFVAPLFSPYLKWFRRRLQPDLERRARLHLSHFPGDFCLEVEIDDGHLHVGVGFRVAAAPPST